MANAAPKKKPMRSRRSGVKKKKLVDANLAILAKCTSHKQWEAWKEKKLDLVLLLLLIGQSVQQLQVIEA